MKKSKSDLFITIVRIALPLVLIGLAITLYIISWVDNNPDGRKIANIYFCIGCLFMVIGINSFESENQRSSLNDYKNRLEALEKKVNEQPYPHYYFEQPESKSKNSSLKFKDFELPFNCFIKLTWNGKVVFDEYSEDPTLCTGNVCKNVSEVYGEKLVYSMKIKVVSLHHTEVEVEGEE